jgi:hypothetical protein
MDATMSLKHKLSVAVRVAAAAVALAALAGQAAAEGGEPPAYLVLPAPVSAPASAGPEAAVALLHEQVNAQNAFAVLSQNFDQAYNRYDSRAADDFTIPGAVPSWEISAVEVHGTYPVGSQANVDSVNVQLFSNSSLNLPGHLIYSADLAPADASTGVFLLTFGSPIKLIGGGTYWVSAQANKNYATGQWNWFEYLGQNFNPSAWQNPGGNYRVCPNWGARVAACEIGANPDLAFRLHGAESSTYPAPILTHLNPGAMANQDFVLAVEGANIAPAATLQWTVGGTTKQYPLTVAHSGRATANIQAEDAAPYLQTAQVTVTNPGPCDATCVSNALGFDLANRLYLPMIRR